MNENKKINITLRINKEVVDKARELGLNLSSITESILRTENIVGLITPNKIRETYRVVFIDLLNILQEWETYLKIGEEVDDLTFTNEKGMQSISHMIFSFYLSPYGNIEVCDEEGETRRRWKLNENWPINSLFEPEKLIENLIDELYRKAEENKEKIQKLSLLKNILDKIKKEKSKDKKDTQLNSKEILEKSNEN